MTLSTAIAAALVGVGAAAAFPGAMDGVGAPAGEYAVFGAGPSPDGGDTCGGQMIHEGNRP